MKKLLITLMSGALMLSALAGCGKKEEVAPKNDNNTVVESKNKVDASETADSVSPTESVKTEQAEPSDSSIGVEPAGVAVEPPGAVAAADAVKHYASQIYNAADKTYINLEVDSDGNLTNYSEIIAPYRAKIAEMLSADLTVYKDAIKVESSYLTGGINTIDDEDIIDINVDKVADDDIWLYENSVADFSVGDAGSIDPCPYLAGGIYGKCYLAAVYEILDQRGISRDAIKSFECGFGGFACEIDDSKLDGIYGNSRWNVDHESEVNGDYFYIGIEISLVDADRHSLGYYETVVPHVYGQY